MAFVNLGRKLPTPLGQCLRKLRVDKDENMADMAKKLKVSPAYLSSVELGKSVPTPKLVSMIAYVYGFNVLETQHIHYLALLSSSKITIPLEGLSPEDRELAVTFVRQFNSLTKEQKEQLKEILDGKWK